MRRRRKGPRGGRGDRDGRRRRSWEEEEEEEEEEEWVNDGCCKVVRHLSGGNYEKGSFHGDYLSGGQTGKVIDVCGDFAQVRRDETVGIVGMETIIR